MTKPITFLSALLLSLTVFAQTPEKMSYQAVVRDGNNDLLTEAQVGMQISILQGSASGTAVYVETQTPTSNTNGLVSLEIGSGTVVSGTFTTIDWANGPYFIKTETDPTGGSNYTISGTSQLMSVPYALYAKESGSTNLNLNQVLTENNSANNQQIKDLADPTDDQDAVTKNYVDDLSPSPGDSPGDMLYWDGSSWVSIEATENEGATLQMIGGEPQWVGGTPPPEVPDAPTITSVTAGDGQVDITFDAPSNDGGSTITEYTATSNPGGITGTLSQAGSGIITVTGLTNGTAYTFTVTATNAVGTSSPSSVSNSVTPSSGPQIDDYPEGTVHCDPNDITEVVDVTNPTTGKTWMDRNLGASQVATSSTDAAAYGDLYQWGRGADGHQCRDSGTTTTLSSTDQPGHGDFITNSSSPYDWRNPKNDNLWQGVNGVNNPCPSGYRLPTEAELVAERESWSSNNSAGAFASPLKLPVAGYRDDSNASLDNAGSNGYYWSSTVSSTNSRRLGFRSSGADMGPYYRAYGFSVRCLKD